MMAAMMFPSIAQITGDLGDRLARLDHHLHRFSLELRAEPSALLRRCSDVDTSSKREALSKILGTPQSASTAWRLVWLLRPRSCSVS
jgi:hypothetical protein